jgi:hypothetical protein
MFCVQHYLKIEWKRKAVLGFCFKKCCCIILSVHNTEMYNDTSMHFLFGRKMTCETLCEGGNEHVQICV